MNNAIALLGEKFGTGNENETIAVLKQTAFKGPATDAQMTALCVLARHVNVSSRDCWEWTGALSRGYGQITYFGKHFTAHRFALSVLREPIKPGAWVLHHCDNRLCINPDHLYQGTPIDNRRDMLERNRWGHKWSLRSSCAAGHLYGENFYRARDGSRVCRTCQRDSQRAYRARQSQPQGAQA